MTQCQQCHATLVAEGIPRGQQVRCVNCANLFRLGEAEKISADRLAWRSFWLGLSSLLLLFFTGIPAIYYGIRSLLRMRFSKPGPGDRFAAVAGTVMGTIFGLFGGLLAIGLGLILSIVFMTLEISEDQGEIAEKYATLFEQAPPAGMIPTRGTSLLNAQYFFDFVDDTEPTLRSFRMHVIHYRPSLRQTSSQIIAHLRRRQVSSQLSLEEKETEILKWQMAGQDIDVRKTVFDIVTWDSSTDPSQESEDSKILKTEETDPQDGSPPEPIALADAPEVVQYFGYCQNDAGITGMTISIRHPNPKFSEEMIRQIFAKLQARSP